MMEAIIMKDADGIPLRLYHGGLAWDVPDIDIAGRGALWLTPDVKVAASYADQYTKSENREIKVFHVLMQNPLDLTKCQVVEMVFGENAPDNADIARNREIVEYAVKYARMHGYDGVIHPDSDVYNRIVFQPSYVVFEKSQLQLATQSGDESQWNLYDIPLRHANCNAKLSKDYPPQLKSNVDLANYIESISSDFVDRQRIEEYFQGAGAVLKRILISDICEGDPDGNAPSAAKDAAYLNLPADTAPPIVIEDGVIIDGHHRFRNAKNRGNSYCWCYDVVDADDLLMEPKKSTPKCHT